MSQPSSSYDRGDLPPDDEKLVELDEAHGEAAAVFQLSWRRLAEYVHSLEDEALEELWDATSDALMAMMTADEVKTKLGLKILLAQIPEEKRQRG